MPVEATRSSAPDSGVPKVQAGESWKQYINRLRAMPGLSASEMCGIIAATVLMGRKPDAPAKENTLRNLAQRVSKHSSFRALSRDPEALRLAQRGKGTELILRMGSIKQRKDEMLRKYRRGQDQVRDDARFLKAASKSMRDSFAGQNPAQRERESQRFMEMMKRLDYARKLAEQGIALDGKTARELAQAVQRYNDGGSKLPGGKREAAASKEALCVLKRLMPSEEFTDYCGSINRAQGALDPSHRRHVEPDNYTEALLNGGAGTAKDLMLAAQRQMNQGMTLDGCATVTAIMQLSRNNPNAIISKSALNQELSKLKSPGSAFLRAMSDDKARERYAELASKGDTVKLGRSILRDAKAHAIRAAQWQANQASGAAGREGNRLSPDQMASILAAREMAMQAGPAQNITNGAFKAKAEEIRGSEAFAALSAQYEKDPACRDRIQQGLSKGDGGKALSQEFEKQKSPAAVEQQQAPVLRSEQS